MKSDTKRKRKEREARASEKRKRGEEASGGKRARPS